MELNKDLILIEISNKTNNDNNYDISNAEKVKDLLINKRIDIVKGFNLISSYLMNSCLNIDPGPVIQKPFFTFSSFLFLLKGGQ